MAKIFISEEYCDSDLYYMAYLTERLEQIRFMGMPAGIQIPDKKIRKRRNF